MKLRQKLAAVLAATMIVTAVPVVTFAGSTNTIVNKQVGKKDRVYGHDENDLTTGPILRIKLDDTVDTNYHDGLFYLDVEGFEFDQAQYNRDNEIFTNLEVALGLKAPTASTLSFGDLTVVPGKKCLKVDLSNYEDVYGTSIIPEDTYLFIPLFGKVTGDVATVSIDNNGLEITESKLTFAESKDDKCQVTAEEVTNLFDEGEIGEIVFTEPYEGVVASKAKDLKYRTTTINGVTQSYPGFEIKLTIDNSEFEFFDSNDTLEITAGKGFASTTFYGKPGEITSKYGDEMTIWVPAMMFQKWDDANSNGVPDNGEETSWVNSKGLFRIKGLHVGANTRTPKEGDLTIKVDSPLGEATALKVANIVLTDTKLYMKDEKTLDIVAGQSKDDAVFFLEENVKDGILPNHTVKFELSEGAYFGKYDESDVSIKNATRQDKVDSAKQVIKAKTDNVEIVDVKMDGTKFVGFTAKFVAVDVNRDGDYTDHEDINAAPIHSKDKYEFEAPICVDLDTADGKEVKLTAYAERSIDEEVSCTAAKVIAPVKVEAEAMVVKVGLQKQKYEGKVVITETANDRIKRGDLIISTPAEGYKFTGKGEVKVTSGDLVINKWDNKNGQIEIEIKHASKTASTIELTGFEVSFDRTVPEGSFPIKIGGNALSSEHAKDGNHDHGTIEVKDFFKINTRNTEDIRQGALKAVVATFTAGSSEYTVDGVSKTMDAQAYIQDSRIMVPARYVAEAFGIVGDNVLFSNGVATIIAGEKIIQLKAGSDIMTVNGMAIKMDTKAVIKDGRTYLPLKFIAVALGVESSFDSATKTATFDNRDAK